MKRASIVGLAIWAVCLATSVRAADVDLKVGDPAPVFESKDDEGKAWKSSDHVGKKFVVVYFYPADCTGGCTKQAQAFRDDKQKLDDLGVEVVGVSGDTVKSHQLFKKLEKINFTLLADEDGSVAKSFGVPLGGGGEVKKEIDGKVEILPRTVTAKRWTFVIGKDGKILSKNVAVNAPEDSKAVIKVVEGAK